MTPASNLGQNCPRAAASTSWPGGLAEGPWRAGQRWPVQQICKHWPLKHSTHSHKNTILEKALKRPGEVAARLQFDRLQHTVREAAALDSNPR